MTLAMRPSFVLDEAYLNERCDLMRADGRALA
jgi:hypothetical protein